MCTACWIPKATHPHAHTHTHTHTNMELSAFALQQWLHERASVSCNSALSVLPAFAPGVKKKVTLCVNSNCTTSQHGDVTSSDSQYSVHDKRMTYSSQRQLWTADDIKHHLRVTLCQTAYVRRLTYCCQIYDRSHNKRPLSDPSWHRTRAGRRINPRLWMLTFRRRNFLLNFSTPCI